jgi:hypothetical protein
MCPVPAGVAIDVRLEVPGFAPAYDFGVAVTPGATADLGLQMLSRGGSVAGFVTPAPPRGTTRSHLRLVPQASPRADSRPAIRAFETAVNARGFFQFTAIPAGAYFLYATRQGFSEARLPVTVSEGMEYALPKPLAQRPLRSVQLFISPPRDASGSPWVVHLDGSIAGSALLRTVVEKPADETGAWRMEGLNADSYFLSIKDASGTVHKHDVINVEEGDQTAAITLTDVLVRGLVHAGGHGFECNLRFRQPGGVFAVMKSDQDGEFKGQLPRAGKWTVDVTTKDRTMLVHRAVTVREEERKDDGYVPLDIDLPAGVMTGRVVDASDKPIRAEIEILRENKSIAQGASNDEGMFEIHGIEPGSALIRAYLINRGESDPIAVDITETTPEAKLVLRERVEVNGVVTGPDGNGLAGAIVRFVLPQQVIETVSGPAGVFHGEDSSHEHNNRCGDSLRYLPDQDYQHGRHCPSGRIALPSVRRRWSSEGKASRRAAVAYAARRLRAVGVESPALSAGRFRLPARPHAGRDAPRDGAGLLHGMFSENAPMRLGHRPRCRRSDR